MDEPGRTRRQQGASLVEFALILPVFLMLLFGMITAGLALNEKQQMTYATREGARYAATIAPTQSFTTGTWASNVRDLIVERSVNTLESADVCVSLVEGDPGTVVSEDGDGDGDVDVDDAAYYSTTGGVCIPDQPYPTADNDTGLRVQVTATKPAEIDLVLFGVYELTLEAAATARSESAS